MNVVLSVNPQTESVGRGAALILASASPRRRALLAVLLAEFDVIPSPFCEPDAERIAGTPAVWAAALAYFKARSVSERHAQRWVLGADTIVACAGRVLGKPRDEQDARAMLELQGRCVSEVITGVALVRGGGGGERRVEVECTRVWMRDAADERERYLQSGDWAGKAGAYGIQSVGDRLVARIAGSFSNVVGLPLARVARLLRGAGFAAGAPPADDGRALEARRTRPADQA